MSSTEQFTGTTDYQATIRVKASPDAVFDVVPAGREVRHTHPCSRQGG